MTSKVDFKYHLLPSSLTIVMNGSVYHVASGTQRYDEGVKAINEGRHEELLDLIDPTLRLGVEGFSAKDGLIYFKNEPLPSVIGELLLKYKTQSVPFQGVVNFYLNIRYRFKDYEKAQAEVVRMMNLDGYAFTSDGFVILYNQPMGFNELREYKMDVPMYSYGNVDHKIRQYFKEKKTLEFICQEVYGFNSKKLTKLVLERFLNNHSKTVRVGAFNYGIMFKGVLSNDNIFRIMENEAIASSVMNTPRMIAENAATFFSHFSEKKILSFFNQTFSNAEEVREFFDHLAFVIEHDAKLRENNIIIDYSLFSTLKDMYEESFREVQKIKEAPFHLHPFSKFPILRALPEKINDDWYIELPNTNFDLALWGQKMKNCIGGYGSYMRDGDLLVFAILDKSKKDMLFNVEIRDREIRQMVSKRNLRASDADLKTLHDFLYEHGLVD